MNIIFSHRNATNIENCRQEVQDEDQTPSKTGRKKYSWDELGSQGKNICTASIKEQVEPLANDRGTNSATILSNMLHR